MNGYPHLEALELEGLSVAQIAARDGVSHREVRRQVKVERQRLEADRRERMNDAARSAVAVVRSLLQGDASAVADLVATLDDDDLSALCGSLAAIATGALRTVDAVIAHAQAAGYCGDLSGHGSDAVLSGIQRQIAG